MNGNGKEKIMSEKNDENAMPRKFIVDSYPNHYLTGILPSGEQVIVGILLPHIWMYTFDSNGFPIKRNKHALSYIPQQKNGIYMIYSDEAEEKLSRCLDIFVANIQLNVKPIEVQEFFDDDNYVGATRYSREIDNFIENREELDDDEQIEMAEQLKEWDENKYAIICWSEEYTIDSQGKTIN
jgi:hypothetical protein